MQADILKEDQAQNTCIFSTEFALRMMGDIQQYFIEHGVRNFYSVSISGLPHRRGRREPDHAARADAGQRLHVRRVLPRARHEDIDDFAPNLSFFFSQRRRPRVLGHRPRRPPHLGEGDEATSTAPTSAAEAQVPHPDVRPLLHAQEIASTTSARRCRRSTRSTTTATRLHTNAYDEAITTPTEESVRRALAIQLIINKELGLVEEREPAPGQRS